MTDITATPASAPAAASAPPPAAPPPTSNEVVIDPNISSRPNPIGAQTGNVSEQRQAAVERAFARARGEKVDKGETKERPGPAKAAMGHNQPPEPTAKEPIDLRRRPQQQEGGVAGTPLAADGAVESGRHEQRRQQPAQPAANGAPVAVNPLPPDAPYREPPRNRMDPQAAAEWHATPATVRRAVHRMHQQFSQFYQRARPDVEAMRELRPFFDLARSQGTSLANAVNNYWTMEQKLRGDPLAGLDLIVHNLNLRTPDGQQITFRDICHYVTTQSPEQLKQVQTRNVQGAHNLQIAQLSQAVTQLANMQRQMHAQQEYARRRRQESRRVNAFAETHPRTDELSATIVAELPASGYDLEVAYRRAELLRPATTAAQTRTQPAQTRTTDRSIHGAPSGSSANGRAPPRPAKERTLDDSIRDAVRRVRGTL